MLKGKLTSLGRFREFKNLRKNSVNNSEVKMLSQPNNCEFFISSKHALGKRGRNSRKIRT